MANNSSFIESHGNITSHSESAYPNIQHINIMEQRQTLSSDLEYWTDRLRDKEQCLFPVLNDGLQQGGKRKGIEVRGPEFAALDKFRQHHQLKWSTLFQTAWGLVIRIYSGLDEVCFGFEQISSPLLPCSLKLARESSLLHTLDTVGVEFSRDSQHRECSLKDIEAALDVGKAGLFNTSVVLLDHEELPEEVLSHENTAGRGDTQQSNTNGVNTKNLGAYSDTASTIEVKIIISRKSVSMTLNYCLSNLSDGQAANVASALEQALACLLKSSHQSIGDQDLFSQHHQQQVQQWNKLRPSSINMTLHEAISTQVKKQPEVQAINAWDEQWSYRQMDELSSKLACHLVEIGVKTGINVPLLFERSAWWVIALLAVSKAGGTFVPVDPEMPLLRLKEVMMDVKPKILLCSDRYSELLASTVENTVVMSRRTLEDISKNGRSSTALPKVSPEHVAYIMFTSGSTGQPKGAMIRHGGYLGALLRWVDGPTITPESHVLQASSYAWSVCIIETICALWHGACLCIPSEYSKQNDLAGVFNDMHITWALLSPSIVKSIQPESIKYLKTLILAGEPVSREVVSKWASEEMKVWIAWAATECLAITGSKNFTAVSDVQNLGPCRGVCRVVEMGNHERQVPIGAVGEIVVHAPWIADGYLNDAERTANTFLDRPDWLDGIPSSYGSRWYKVGDLVRQNSDGSLMLAGRGDNMVKIRGQRFDMSEVERKLADDEHIRNSLPILPKVGICKHRLVAMVALHGFAEKQPDVDGKIEILKGDALQKATAWLSKFQRVLANRLQTFATPTIWLLVKEIPLTITGKIDRVAVKRFVERMDLETYEEVTALGVEKQPPVTTTERILAKIWSGVLEIPLERVGRNQSFISLGGDSILAMIVGARCRDSGIQLSVQDILKHSTIAELSLQASPMVDGTLNDAALAGRFDDLRVSIRKKLQQANVDTNSVEDCYPSSPMVTGMLLSKARLTGDYNTSTIYEVVPRKAEAGMLLSVEKLLSAWQEVVQRHATLRSFFIESTSQSGSFDQIVLRKYNTDQSTHVWNVTIDSTEDVIAFFNKHQPKPLLSLNPPHNFSILLTTSGRLFCRLNVEHTLVDGMSLAVIVSDLKRAYDNNLNALPEPPFYSSYIASIQQVVCSVDNKYWKAYLEGMHPCLLPNLTYSLSREAPKAESRALGVEIRNPQHLLKFCQSQELTLSALFRTVWGLILRAYTGSDEVCFGYITSGRDLPVPGIGEIVGTFINMLVCRMDLKGTRPVKDIIAKAQSDYLASLPHQHASLAQIQHVLGLYGQRLFNTSMTILKQVPVDSGDGTIDIHNIHEWSPNEYDLDVQVWTSSTSVKMELWYRSETISDEHAHNIASTFGHALDIITDDPDQRIDQLNLFAPEHGSQLWKWNAQCPESINSCLHDLISHQAIRRPHEIAVHSWDTDLTFNQLEVCSDRLAHHLVSLGVGPEVHVLHCFEKSALAIVAMLSILKAGGICVSIDPSHPSQRLQRIIKDTRPLCCLVSSLHESLFQSIEHGISHVVTIQPRLFDSDGLPSAYAGKACSSVGPANAAFVLFTSGSTGTPKGIVHEHRTIASSLHHHGLAMNIGVDARTLQFSAFVFDVSITEIFMSLTRGGTLCIPSEDERMNSLESSINRMKANWAHLTPTVASLLDPTKVPTLKHLALAGEPLKKINVTEWAPNLELVNLYGPAECALATTLRVGLDENDRPDNIGKAVGLLTWLVDPSNTDRLVPLGAVGEVLLEGPNIAREYLKDKERTLSSFIENPAWLREKARNPPRRFYRSGDLARYNGDGSIQILGRIDTQVKMHGQRVELGEIEYQIRANLSNQDLSNLAVVYAKSSEHPGGGLLAAFLEFRQKSPDVDNNHLMVAISDEVRKNLVKLDTHLAESLPSYMVPAIYVPTNAMPLLTAGKIDRGKLSRIVLQLSTQQVGLYSLSEFQDQKVKPRSRMERTLHALFAEVLNIDLNSIGIDDNFFRLGGDSVVAMRLAAAGRKAGLTITVAEIFQHPKLSDLATISKPWGESTVQALEKQYDIPRKMIEDIYPCTPLQEGLMILSTKQPESYLVQQAFSLPLGTDIGNFLTAWETVYNLHPVLRTRIVQVENAIGSIQVVLKQDISWKRPKSLSTYLNGDRKLSMGYGKSLTRFALIQDSNHEGDLYFVLTCHHAICDDAYLTLLFSDVEKAYDRLAAKNSALETSEALSYKSFINGIFNMDLSAAETFWYGQFSSSHFSIFPKLPSGYEPQPDETSKHIAHYPEELVSQLEFPFSTFIRAAWALLLSRYSDSSETVAFGMTLDGRSDSKSTPGISEVRGPTIATIPVKISINVEITIKQFLKELQDQAEATRPYQHFGLQNIKALGPDAAEACAFQSLLAIQEDSGLHIEGEHLFGLPVAEQEVSSSYPLSMRCKLKKGELSSMVQYDPRIISGPQIKRIIEQFEHILQQMIAKNAETKYLTDIQLYSPRDVQSIFSWNYQTQPKMMTCVHDVITAHIKKRPNAMAVCSWDENMTYQDLDNLSTKLAYHLKSHFNIGPESLVPLCFAKSAWAVVAMIGILKAGGAYVPMDPSHPKSRLYEIVEATKAQLILCSPQYEDLSCSLASQSLVVSRKALSSFNSFISSGPVCQQVRPNNIAYVIFTSGSTGKPKGVVMEHQAFCAAATDHGKRVNLNSSSRVIHFSSYAFEACILEILTTLFNGGCVCIAPDSQRLEDITRVMRDLRVNWAFFTPSFIRTVTPDQVPDLKTLVLGGEALGSDNIDVWVDKVFLVNGYGPSETCVFSVVNEKLHRGDSPDLIGSAVGGACWIVDPDDHRKLTPVGCVGELLIEGPTLARGYLNDPDKTTEVFVDNLSLFDDISQTTKTLLNGSNKSDVVNGNQRHRMYKTGDLVRYDTSKEPDGTIRFVGRKDTQIKVRGQRMELGEIEYHLTSKLPLVKHVVVEQFQSIKRETKQLAAFFSLDGNDTAAEAGKNDFLLLPLFENLKKSVYTAEAALAETLPSYMVPSLWVPLSKIPLLSSGKTDRQRLRSVASGFSESEAAHYSLVGAEKRTPVNEMEKKVAKLWIQILRLDRNVVIGLDDSFFRLGGDSISAMRLTSLARENKLVVSVAEIFKSPRLEDMAALVKILDENEDLGMSSFSLLWDTKELNQNLSKLEKQYGISSNIVEDALPSTPLAEGLMLLSIKNPGSYMSQITLSLRPEVNIDRFKSAWERTAERNSVLRTRFAHSGSRSIQVVTKDKISWAVGSNLQSYLTRDKKVQMDYGDPLIRCAIIEESAGDRYFVLTAHHSLYDGWSLILVMEELDHLYNDGPLRSAPPTYSRFIKHLMNIDLEAGTSFWKRQFDGKSLLSFPDPRSVTQARAETQVSRFTEISRPTGSDITLSTVIRTAWGLVTAKYAGADDVFFGATLMGRNTSLPYIEKMTGPTITTVPICISIDDNQSVASLLRAVQEQATEMIPFEHTGLQNIKRIGPEAEKACNFQNLLVIQPEGSEDIKSNIWQETALFAKGEMVTLTYALIVECRLYKNRIRITAQYRDHIIPERQIQRMMDLFEQTLHHLNDNLLLERAIKDIEMTTKKDKEEISSWNRHIDQTTSEDCIHHIIERQARDTPKATAIHSWDAELTFGELEKLSSQLAGHLTRLGVYTNQIVPICFDKSAWAIVAMLAVMKAGAAYVSLDPKHPASRKNHIIQDTSAKVILTGSQYENSFDATKYNAISIYQTFISNLPEVDIAHCKPGDPSNAAFVVFTSGSTGVPKGIVMEHGSFCSSAREHSKALRITSRSRVMQFAAYTYDVSMGEIFTTLMQGGCVCVPSEEDRLSKLALSINKLKANWIFLTPTIAGFLKPNEVPGLEVLVLGGEHATASNIKTWASKVHLINSYGPAECAIWCACSPGVRPDADPSDIGRPVGASLWITDINDSNKLMPIGGVGELVVEGPTLAREYLNDRGKTAAAFIENPKWSWDTSRGRRRMYRTGDLVRYGSEGNILFVGRRDTQAKLHGQRIELGEIEQNLIKISAQDWVPVVDILRFQEDDRDAILIAFIHLKSHSTLPSQSNEIVMPVSGDNSAILNKLRSQLEQILPSHMCPQAYILINEMPLTAGGKIDRVALRKLGEGLTVEELLPYLLNDQSVQRPPETDMEKRLQQLWAKVLNITPDKLGKDSSFLRVGGDSVAAMRLSAAAREIGILLTVRSVFKSPKLEDMSLAASLISSSELRPHDLYKPFSLLKTEDLTQFLKHTIYPQIQGVENIEDVLEATDYQRWTLGCGQLKTRGYNNYFIFHMKGFLDIPRLEYACRQLVQRHPILRTVFVPHKNQLFQVVLKNVNIEFIQYDCKGVTGVPHLLFEQDMKRPVVLEHPGVRFLLAKQGDDGCRLIMRSSHAQYDGISLPIIVRDLKAAYLDEKLSGSLPYSTFIHGLSHTMPLSEAESYWRNELAGSVMTNVVAHSKPDFRNAVNTSLKQVVTSPSTILRGITFATTVKTAWALLLAQLSSSLDVVFGQITTGRNASIQGIDEIVGPCMNLVPVRIKVDSAMSFLDLLQIVQDQHLEMSAYESLGFQHIIEQCTTWPKWTRFSSILQHTNFNIGMNAMDMWGSMEMHLGNFTPDHDVADVWIWTGPSGEDFVVDFTYSDRAISEPVATQVLASLCETIKIISDNPTAAISSLNLRIEARFPLPSTETIPAKLSPEAYHSDSDLESITHAVWRSVFGDYENELSDKVSFDMPYYKLRGDLLASAQLAAGFRSRGFEILPEEIIDNPTMRSQKRLVASKEKKATRNAYCL